METLILLVPTDLKSFLLGVCSGAIVLFATGFLQKAGEHSFEWIKRKFMSAPCAITDHDKELFRAFKTLFSDSGIIMHYKDHDFLLPFNRSYMAPLATVVEHWGDESHNFVNVSLQQAKVRFFLAAKSLAEEIWRYTSPDRNGNLSLMARDMDYESLPDYMREEAKKIDSKLPEFVESHEALVRLGRSLL